MRMCMCMCVGQVRWMTTEASRRNHVNVNERRAFLHILSSAPKRLTYLELLHNGHSESEAFQELGLKRYWYAFAPAASECADMS